MDGNYFGAKAVVHAQMEVSQLDVLTALAFPAVCLSFFKIKFRGFTSSQVFL